MALLQPFFSDTFLSKTLQFSPTNPSPKRVSAITRRVSAITRRARTVAFRHHPPPQISYQNFLVQAKEQRKKCHAVSEQVGGGVAEDKVDQNELVDAGSTEEEIKGESEVVPYDWTEEWYPLYLTENVPDDAPLGLTVFDKQLVLYRDGTGELRCFEDRCPHR